MNQQKRLQLIMDQLVKEKSLSLQDIMTLTGASRDTTRRDMIKLADHQLVTRNYGGISLKNSFNKIDTYLDRSNNLTQTKKAIAKKAISFVTQNQTLYFDVSTTVSLLPQFLPTKKALYALTNGLDISDQLLRNTLYQTTMLGGKLNRETRAVTGGLPLLELSKYAIDIAFLSCAGIDEKGIYYAHDEDIAMKTMIRQQAKTVVLLCDHTKIGLTHNFLVYPFKDIDYLVTDQRIPEELAKKIGENKIIYTKEQNND